MLQLKVFDVLISFYIFYLCDIVCELFQQKKKKSSQKFFSMKAGCDCGIFFMFICSHIRLLVSASSSPCFDLEILSEDM